MNIPQGLCYFSGIQSLLSAQFTLQHGISPSVATVRIPPQQGQLLEGGAMVWTYGGVRITFPGCKVDRITAEIDGEGREIWALSILDRRWRWRETGAVSGYYNTRRGEAIAQGAEKTPRELAELCLRAMGEQRYNLSGMPNDQRPEVEWEYENPAQALAAICDQLGCRVVLKLDDSVSIEKAGSGAPLPTGGDVRSNTLALDPPERPDAIVIVAGRSRFQVDMKLEPVVEDVDLVVKPIEQLLFQPRGGWKNFSPDMVGAGDAVADWYRRTVFKWYRIKPPIEFPDGEKVNDVNAVLPLEKVQVVRERVFVRPGQFEEGKPLPAWVYGKFWSEDDDAEPADPQPFSPLEPFKPRSVYRDEFELDVERGIVKFKHPVRLLDPGQREGQIPADLRLRCAVSLRHKETRAWLHYEERREKRGKKFGTLPRYIKRDDIALHIFVDPLRGVLVDNLREVQRQANHYLDVAEREYQLTDPRSITYAGIKPINPDGAIQQVTFSINDQGFATTQASRNREESRVAMSYHERRFVERLHQALGAAGENGRVRKAKAEKAER